MKLKRKGLEGNALKPFSLFSNPQPTDELLALLDGSPDDRGGDPFADLAAALVVYPVAGPLDDLAADRLGDLPVECLLE